MTWDHCLLVAYEITNCVFLGVMSSCCQRSTAFCLKNFLLAFLERQVFVQSVLQFVFFWGFVNVPFISKMEI